ncbi:MAG: tetratricopeptide repeat protein [Deltaproteobacteria bacterium]|nr:tetratricopeptide repeat protein [Deltaproteobacteria bacterium]
MEAPLTPQSPRPTSRKRTLIAMLVLAAVCVGVYANAPSGGFVWDDINLIEMDHQIRDFRFLGEVFTRDFFGFQENTRKYGYYRPLVTISYMVDYALWGPDARGFHATNILFHVLATLALFAVFLRLARGRHLTAFVPAVLFAVHPLHVETVSWVSGRTDALCAVFYFMSLWAFMAWADRRAASQDDASTSGKNATRAYLALSVVSFGLAMLAKEMAITVPAVAAIYVLIFHTGFDWRRLKAFALPFVLFTAVAVIYAYVRVEVVQVSDQAKEPWGAAPTLITFLWSMVYYTMKMAWPMYQRGYIRNPLIDTVFDGKAVAGLLFVGGMVWLIWTTIRKDRPIAFAASFLLISFLPISNFVRISGPRDMGFVTAERFAYIPSAAFAFLVGAVIARLMSRWASMEADEKWGRLAHRVGAFLVFLALVGFFTGLTLRRTAVWKTNESFFQDSIAKAPGAPLLYLVLGNVYSLQGRYDEAEHYLLEAIRFMSSRDREEPTWAYSDLAGIYARQGQYEKAMRYIKLANRGRMNNAAVKFNMGEIYRSMGDLESAAEQYRQSLALDSANLNALEQLSAVLTQLGEYRESNQWLARLNEFLPANAGNETKIGRNFYYLRQSGEAERHLRRAISIDSGYLPAYDILGTVYLADEKPQEAMAIYRQALAVNPNFLDARVGLANALAMAGNNVGAYEELQKVLEKSPKHRRALIAIGQLAMDQRPAGEEHWRAAEQAFAAVLQTHPDDVQAMLSMGVMFDRKGKPDQAAIWFHRVLERDTDNEAAKSYLEKIEQQSE